MLTLQVSGSPRERGQQHGEVFRREIREFSAIRAALLREALVGFSESDIAALCQTQLAMLGQHPDLHEEFLGITEGAGISPAELIILNNHTDMRNYIKSDAGCSSFALRTPGSTLCGQTWDMAASAMPYVLHLEIAEAECTTHVLTVTGCLGMMGVSSHNVAVMMNDLKTDETGDGLLWPAIIRGMLQTPATSAAAMFLERHLPCSGHHYLACDEQSFISIETTGQRTERVAEAADGVWSHTNHYLGALAAAALPPSQEGATTRDRHEILQRYFAAAIIETLQAEQIGHELFGTIIPDNGVCIVPNEAAPDTATCGGVIFDMKKRQGVIFSGPYTDASAHPIKW